jgi:hypothetical protein
MKMPFIASCGDFRVMLVNIASNDDNRVAQATGILLPYRRIRFILEGTEADSGWRPFWRALPLDVRGGGVCTARINGLEAATQFSARIFQF